MNHQATTGEGQRWRQLYEAALMEPDRVRLLERIQEAQAAITQRAHELFNRQENSSEERQALARALYGLSALAGTLAD